MRRTVALTFVVVLGLIVGCASTDKGKNVAAVSPVLDVAPMPTAVPSPEPTPAVAAAPVAEPVAFAAPTPLPPEPVASKAASSSKSYTVKKGDTLFSIAKAQLGSGKDWQKIAAANPGLTPQKLRAGQQIAMP